MDNLRILLSIIGVIIALISLIYAKKSFSKDYGVDRENELIEKLRFDFFVTRNTSLECSQLIKELIEEYNLGESLFIDSFTYNDYLRNLIHSQEKNLKEDTIENALNQEATIPFHVVESMIKSINKQKNELSQIYTHLEIVKHNLKSDKRKR
ncbi:hypothetical protein [Empedobacter tilapiae]|uniref:Uncharacterized protein n=1 Tax=Empedobacter tilapiae TaxID=2491114 RepID=A0A4Z1B2M1_9FLAO|nr:hypothetical protein [Empedobacter tilapiae]TGN21684.1 hypothetical protein E4J94_17200 [Empedobacter tilapiae]